MEKPFRVVVQEADDDMRDHITQAIKSDDRFVLVASYKSFHFMLQAHPMATEADIVLMNWQYPKEKLHEFFKSKIIRSQKCIVTFDFVQPDLLVYLEYINFRFFLIKPFITDDLLQPQRFLSEYPFLAYHTERIRLKHA